MAKKIIELMIGDLEEKRSYRRLTKRVEALPEDYRIAFKKIRNYIYYSGVTGCNMTIFSDLIELFEISAAEGKSVVDIVGGEAGSFCDELIRAASIDIVTLRDKLNHEILEHFNMEESTNA